MVKLLVNLLLKKAFTAFGYPDDYRLLNKI